MKRLTKIIALIFSYSIIAIINDSCHSCPRCNYDIKGINLNNLIYNSNICNTCTDITDTSLLQYSKYGVRINFNKTLCLNDNRPSNLENSAFAMDCFTLYNLETKIESITVYSLDDFDINHKANSDISEYFEAININHYSEPVITTIEATLNDTHGINESNHLGDYDYIDLLLTKAPAKDSLYSFKIKVKLTDIEYIDTSKIIIITK